MDSSTITLLAALFRQLRTDVPTRAPLCADHEHNYQPRQLANLLLGTSSATSLLMSMGTLSRVVVPVKAIDVRRAVATVDVVARVDGG